MYNGLIAPFEFNFHYVTDPCECEYVSCDTDSVYLYSFVFAAIMTLKRAPAILIKAYDGIFSQIPQ